jgi:acetoin utilization deacetylase AcuC-like enzyme
MDRLVYFYPEGHEAHRAYGHPERPERISSIVEHLGDRQLWAPYEKIPGAEVPPEILTAVHSEHLLAALETAASRGGFIDPDTYVTSQSWDLALQAAGGAIAVAEKVWAKKAANGFALCRPPGHHATRDQAMGFCLINNAAVAAEYLLQIGGAARVAILDIDLHHGNGTQDIFYSRDDVLYISTHQFPLYPGTGRLDEIGIGEGRGFTINLPFPPYSGDQAMLSAVDEVILPGLQRFDPDFILISAGVDTHWRDPLGHMQVTAGGYGQVVHRIREFSRAQCGKGIVCLLEGGYDLEGGSACVGAAVSALLEKPYADALGKPPYDEALAWKDVIQAAKVKHNL